MAPGSLDRGVTAERDLAAIRARGLLLVGVGVLLLSPDVLFIRLIDMDDGTLIFFRGALTMVGFLVLLRATSGPLLRRDLWALGKAGVAVACLLVVANVGFVTSVRATDATVVLVIVSSAPMFALIIGRRFTSEAAPMRTWVASATVLAGVAAIFLAEAQGGGVSGALAALGGTLAIATILVIVEHSGGQDMLPAQALGALLTALVALPFAAPASVSGEDVALVVASGLFLLPLSLALILQGPRYLSAAETSLVTLPEVILGPAWIWLVIGERPPLAAVLAGLLILGTLVVHTVLSQRALSAASP